MLFSERLHNGGLLQCITCHHPEFSFCASCAKKLRALTQDVWERCCHFIEKKSSLEVYVTEGATQNSKQLSVKRCEHKRYIDKIK